MFNFPAGLSDPLDEIFDIQRSLRFRSSAPTYFARTPVAGNRQTWTFSAWVKRGKIGAVQTLFSAYNGSTNSDSISFDASDRLQVFLVDFGGAVRLSSARYRDPSAHYHVVVSFDTPNATAQSRCRIWVCGIEIAAFDTNATISQNFLGLVNSSGLTHSIGRYIGSGYFDGLMSEVNFVDGLALDATYFGRFHPKTGQWRPKRYSGSYGTNGFYLPFSDGSSVAALGYDKSGNGNNFTATNFSLTAGETYDWMLDTPTDNYPVIDPLFGAYGFAAGTMSDGNLKFVSSSTYHLTPCTIPIPKYGQWMAEFKVSDVAGFIGVVDLSNASGASQNIGGGYAWYGTAIWTGNASAAITGLTAWAANDIIGVAVDASARTVKWYRNGALVATQALSASKDYAFACGDYHSSASATIYANFGQRSFAYPITGYSPLSTKRMVFPAIENPKLHFDVVTRTGNGSTQAISSLAFAPGFLWTKSRSATYSHALYDVVRGYLGSAIDATGGNGVGYWGAGGYGGSRTAGGSPGVVGSSSGGGGGGGASGGAGGPTNNAGSTVGGTAYIKVFNGATLLTTITLYGSYVVPAGVTSLKFEIKGGKGGDSGIAVGSSTGPGQGWGAGGGGGGASGIYRAAALLAGAPGGNGAAGNGSYSPNPGAQGGVVIVTLAVTPGETLTMVVGGDGGQGGHGYYASGGGGGYGGGSGGGRSGDWGAGGYGGSGAVPLQYLRLSSDLTAAETAAGLIGFGSNGFTYGPDSTTNANGATFVDFCWKAGVSTVQNNDGTISSQISVNALAGFSVVSFTGAGANGTVGHGLGVKPSIYIGKDRDASGNWEVLYDCIDGSNDYMYLNAANVAGNATQALPTASVINVLGSVDAVSGRRYVFYCFANVEGFSKVGKYVGTGDANGPNIICGFRPRWLMVKRADAGSSNWRIHDTARESYNGQNLTVYPNGYMAEYGPDPGLLCDILSNGFKLRGTDYECNAAGVSYLFVAFAEFPFRYANAR